MFRLIIKLTINYTFPVGRKSLDFFLNGGELSLNSVNSANSVNLTKSENLRNH